MKNTPECPFHHELLVSYAAGNTTQAERSLVERHLATCPSCRREVVDLEKTWWALDIWQNEVEHSPLRLNDLRCRLQAARPQETIWSKTRKVCRTLSFSPFQFGPLPAIAGVVGLLILIPSLYTLLPSTPTLKSIHPQMAITENLPEPTHVAQTDSQPSEDIQRQFDQALQESIALETSEKNMAQNEKNLTKLIRLSQGGRLHMTGMGTTLDKNVFSSLETTSFVPNPAMLNMITTPR